jgi:tetratricopeptide (TPR) repeat protein
MADEHSDNLPNANDDKRRKARRFARWQKSVWGEPLATALLGLLIVGAPLLLGGVLAWTVLVITALSLLCLVMVVLRAPAAARQPTAWIAWLFAAGVVWTALQALPLPCSLVAVLARDSATSLLAARALLHHAHTGLCTLSEDPGATREEVLKGVAIVSAFMSAWLVAASGGRRRLLWMIAVSSLVMSGVALAHGLFQLDKVFGLYRPVNMTRTLLLAPLMNLNHLGAFAALGVPLFMGLTYRNPDPNVRLLGYVAIVVCSVAAILSLSRGAIGQLAASVVFMAWLLATRSSKRAADRPQHASARLGVAAASCIGLGAGAYLAGEQVAHEFAAADLSKLDLVRGAFGFALRHPLFGVGRGAFSSAFAAHAGATQRYVYAEDFIAQWASDWGLPFSLLLLSVIGFSLLRSARANPSLPRLGGLTACAAFSLQNLVDFGFELVGVAVVAAALLGACVAPSPRNSSEPTRRALPMRVLAWTTIGFGIAAFALLGPMLPKQRVPSLEAALKKTLTTDSPDAFQRELRQAVELHPAEPGFALIAATAAVKRHDPLAGKWLNRLMQLAPGWAAPHALAFKSLWLRGAHTQALLELRAAAEIDPYISQGDVCGLARVNPRWVLDAAPHNNKRRVFLEMAGYCIATSRPLDATFDQALLHEFPDSILALERSAARLSQQGEVEASLAMADTLIRTHPEFERGVPLRFQILLNAGRLQEVIDGTDKILPRLNEVQQSKLLTIKAVAFARLGASEQATETVAALRLRASTDADRLAESYALEGRIHETLGNPAEAIAAFREAYRVNQDTQYIREVARLAESLGDRPQALWAYINLCQHEPGGEVCTRRNALLKPAALVRPQ